MWRYVASPSTWSSWVPSSQGAVLQLSRNELGGDTSDRQAVAVGDNIIEVSHPFSGSCPSCISSSLTAERIHLTQYFGLPPGLKFGSIIWSVLQSGIIDEAQVADGQAWFHLNLLSDGIPGYFENVQLNFLLGPPKVVSLSESVCLSDTLAFSLSLSLSDGTCARVSFRTGAWRRR